jgi:hypothetical protein
LVRHLAFATGPCSLNQFAEPAELALPRGGSFAAPLRIGASPYRYAFFVCGVEGFLAPAVFLSDAARSRGSGPPQRAIVRSLSSLCPGSRLSLACRTHLCQGPRPVPACVSPEDPLRSKPGLSIPWPRSWAEGGVSYAWFVTTGFSVGSGSTEDTDDLIGFSFFFMSQVL